MAITHTGETRPKRRRRPPEEARRVVLEAARGLLLDKGPQALTLQGVAAAVGMTHGNITHHFGTSAALHAALVADMAEAMAREAEASVQAMRAGAIGPDVVVAEIFEALNRGGYGRLVAWLAASGDIATLEPFFSAVERAVRLLRAVEPAGTDPHARGTGPITFMLLAGALGATLLGPELVRATGLTEAAVQRLFVSQMQAIRAT
ncbi:transcriptional regulator, TetR family [Methylobacterium sp. 4-46]|uniref:TetR/AcrR family transcriptional regulator n=1 Tax=unclassified Methylobacterium TaxID=2615210 RepID=UPI000152D1A7|nr:MULTISPECIES: helix-turn-helix domain-containing protein [Methylobacterium]ACA16301.1 transcriptional regulator, TetR family [Methylobacterium sp. 4-46]WFT82009.1 helix-turn-helix domain containing protein [Methylobacterium nodulans]